MDDRVVHADVSVSVSGALEFSWHESDYPFHLLTVTPPERELRLLSAGLSENGRLPSGERFRVGFDHVGEYDGPGTYQIDPGRTDMSNVLFMYAALADPRGDITAENITEIREFTELNETCSIEVSDELKSGVLHCPSIGDVGGERVELTMTWKQT